MEDSRFILIDKEGNITIVFSSEDNGSSNRLELPFGSDISVVEEYAKSIQDKLYKKGDSLDRHQYYLQDYLKDHYVEEFKRMHYNPQSPNTTDMTMYFFLSEIGVVSLINSSAHHNIFYAPRAGMTKEQEQSAKDVMTLFAEDISWDIVDEARIVIDEYNGKKFADIQLGNRKKIKTNDYINYKVKRR